MQKEPYKAGETGDLPTESKERGRWKKDSESNTLANNLDTWYSTPNYGMLNEHFESVTLLIDENESTLISFSEEEPDVRSASFVVGMFNDFRTKYLDDIDGSPIGPPSHLGDLRPVRAYENFELEYNNYLDYLIASYTTQLFEDYQIVDYSTFIIKLRELIKNEAAFYPVTKSGFNLSRHCPVYCSGFYIDLMRDQSYDLDAFKGELIKSKNFVCFVEYANNHGFLVDKNAPWRLIINLNSPITQRAINVHSGRRMSYKDTLTRIHRIKTNYDDLTVFRNFVVALYSSLLYNNGDYEKERKGEESEPIVSEGLMPPSDNSTGRPKLQNLYEFIHEFTIEKSLSLLLETRMQEVDVPQETLAQYDALNRHLLRTHEIYSERFPNPLTPALNIIGMYSKRWIRDRLVDLYARDSVGRGGYYILGRTG